MYLSRISTREDARGSDRYWTAISGPYAAHQAIWDLFGDHPDRDRDFLYHVKESSPPPTILALSRRPPAQPNELWAVETKPFAPALRTGSRLGFLLRANAVRTRNGKRHDVVMEEKHRLRDRDVPRTDWPSEAELVQEAGVRWLEERAVKCGFRLQTVRADAYRQHQIKRPPGGRPVRLSTIDFTGILEVLEPHTFTDLALGRGMGPAKAFGCGMMLIRRA